jgi:cytochrome P450
MEQNRDTLGILATPDSSLKYSARMGLIPECHPWLEKAKAWLGRQSDLEVILDFVLLGIRRRLGGKVSSDRQDFLTKLLDAEASGRNSRRDTVAACTQNIVAGSDTTAISLSSVIYYPCKNPDKLAKLRIEIDEALLHRPTARRIGYQEAQKLTCLQAIIHESLRLHPTVGQPLVRVVPESGALIAGTCFPAGVSTMRSSLPDGHANEYVKPQAEVGINPWVLHQNEDIFGPDAAAFRPERWLTEDQSRKSQMEQSFITVSKLNYRPVKIVADANLCIQSLARGPELALART